MSEQKSYVVNSIPVPDAQPPSVVFDLSDLSTLTAEPDGARIVVTYLREGLSRVQLWDTERGGHQTVDMELRHPEDSPVKEWRDALVYACEVACALYWSQWRSQLAHRSDHE